MLLPPSLNVNLELGYNGVGRKLQLPDCSKRQRKLRP